MDNSIYVTLSRQMGQFRKLDVVANNIANASTVGYQAERVLFTDYLVDAEIEKEKNIAFTQDISTYRDTTAGRFEQTDNAFDVAIVGPAYFAVETPAGDRYTKAGNFHLNDEGELVTQQGFLVKSRDGGAIVFEPTDSAMLVGEDGLVTVLGLDKSAPREERGVIGLFEFNNDQRMERTGDTLYRAEQIPTRAVRSRAVQGTLEQSNVSPVSELVSLTKLQRSVGSTAKFVEMAYDLQRKMSNTYTQES